MSTETSPPDLILLRGGRDPDPYVQAFAEVGVRAVCTPVLAFTFPNDDALRSRLETPEAYGALIATSPRVGRALQRIFDNNGPSHAGWEGKRAYAVGPKTAEQLRSLSFDVAGEDTGTASALAERIVRDDPDRPLLFLCGNRRRDDLPNALNEAGITFEEQVVYETHTRTDLRLPAPSGESWLVFFSPSGLEAVQAADVPLAEYHCAAIGPTTADALRTVGVSPRAVADTPSPEGLVEAILTARRSDVAE